MQLEQKEDFVTHQALGFAANMLHNMSNLNGGMWSSMAVGDVSC
jgi:hypothetical protein